MPQGEEFTADFLEHHGIKGMKWGVRKDRGVTTTKVKTTATPGKRVTATGGTGQKPHPDAVRARVHQQKAKKSTTDALSNQHLQELVKRMQLEQQYNQLRPKSNSEKTKKFIAGMILNTGKQQAGRVANDFAGQRVGEFLKSK